MKRTLTLLAAGACAAVAGVAAMAQSAPDVTLTRLECGTNRAPADVNERFSDTFAYDDLKLPFVFSCYLIKHGSDFMVWDTGFAMNAGATAPKVSIVDQLAKLKVKPDQIKFVGISHFHADHTGQVDTLPGATLLIGKGDWDGITSTPPAVGANAAPFKHWAGGGGKVEPVALDKDVFGDGSVLMLYTPGHTPGHHSLLVKRSQGGAVILSGDAAHFHENYETDGVPSFNADRAQTIASIDRIKKLAARLKATVVIQHDLRDVGKLPAVN
jgi:N-acyl homoserine lactone hydrolase